MWQFVLQSDLPKIPYWTKADIYIVSCFVYILLIPLQVVVIGLIDEEKEEYWDRIVLICIISAFVLWHVCYVAMVLRAKKHELEKLEWYHADYNGDDEDDDDDDDEDEMSVEHTDFHFDKKVEQRLGAYWEKHLNDEDEEQEQEERAQHVDVDGDTYVLCMC